MKVSYDGTVTFKSESEELFLVEKSGRKANIVCILDPSEYYPLTGTLLKQIIVQYGHQIFSRQISDVRVVGEALGKFLVVFSWQHKEVEVADDG